MFIGKIYGMHLNLVGVHASTDCHMASHGHATGVVPSLYVCMYMPIYHMHI